MPTDFTLTRDAGLARLAAFAPRAGRVYAAERNGDAGPGREPATSALSPWLRRRLLLEGEVARAAIDAHGEAGAEKFVHEVFWRSYFKGHLETRPALWSEYRAAVGAARERLAREPGLRRAHDAATGGRSGIECLDDWSRALVEENWLHNHVRMWFASIWIFTLGLPWALGADFFHRHLIDGDPASNTLSWRWVAGLHTRGKAYAARAENIRRHTGGRYDPTGLNERPEPLTEERPVAASPLPPADRAPEGEIALLLHLDDLHPESLDLGRARVVRVGGLLAHAEGAAARVRSGDEAAMADALARAGAWFDCPSGPVREGWADGRPVVAAWAPVGPSADALPPCARVRRPWDTIAWPRSTRGYFQLRQSIPEVLEGDRATG